MATYTPQSPIAGDSRGTADDWIRWAEQQGVHRFDDVELYINTVYEFAPQVGIGAHKIICQSIHETSEAHPKTGKYIPWTSEAWTECVNPAGIGVTSDAMRTWHDFKNGRNAALAHLVRVCKYVFGPVPDILKPYEHLDPRGAVPASVYGQKKTLGSFGHSDWRNYPTWAANDDYGQKWADTLNRLEPVFAGTSTTPPDPQPDPQEGNDMAELNFDPKLVPMPPHRFKLATNKREGVGMNRFGPRVHRGIVFHRALSNNQSLDTAVGWLLRSDVQGLTDGFIDHRTGEMVIINPMKAMFPNNVPSNWQDMAGWAQGPYSATASWPDGRAFRNKYGGRLGANIINQDLESMEVTGNYDSPLSDACKATLVQWAAARAQYHKIPWDKYPIKPSDGLTMMYGHREFCGDGHKICPGPVVWNFITGELIDRVRAILKKAQTSGATTPAPKPDPQQPVDPWPYPEAHIPEFITNPGAKPYLEDGNGTTLFWTDKQYVAVRPTKRLKYAYDGAPEVGPIIPAGMDFNVAFVFTAHDGKEYGLTPYGTRVLLDDLKVVSDGPLVGDVIDAVKDTLENN